jgi:hypothetical protein
MNRHGMEPSPALLRAMRPPLLAGLRNARGTLNAQHGHRLQDMIGWSWFE